MLANHFIENAFHEMDRFMAREMDLIERAFDRPLGYLGRPTSFFDRSFGFYDRPLSLWDSPLSALNRSLSFIDRPLSLLDEVAPRALRDFKLPASKEEVLNLKEPENVDDNTKVYIKYEINDNGHVVKKVMEKEPGHQWNTKLEEYDVKPALKEGEKQAELKNSEQNQTQAQVESQAVPQSIEQGKSAANSPKKN